MKISGIYIISNELTGELYIGSSVNCRDRWAYHRRDLRADKHTNPLLQKAWNEHGEDSFVFQIVEEVPDTSQLHARENYWIAYYKREQLYNIHTKANLFNHTVSKERAQKISTFHKGKPKTEAHKKAITVGLTGKKYEADWIDRRQIWNEARARVIKEFIDQGITQSEVARWFGIGLATVQRSIKGSFPSDRKRNEFYDHLN